MDKSFLRLKKDFDDFEMNVQIMEDLKRRASRIQQDGFEEELNRINAISRDVRNVNKVENLVLSLEQKARDKRYCWQSKERERLKNLSGVHKDRLYEQLKLEEKERKFGLERKHAERKKIGGLVGIKEKVDAYREKRKAEIALKESKLIEEKISELEDKKKSMLRKLSAIEAGFNGGFISEEVFKKSKTGLERMINEAETQINNLKKKKSLINT